MKLFFQSSHFEKGFIALISAVIISTVLLGLALTAGTSSAYSRFNALNAEYKRASLALAESCANVALLRISQNYNYAPTNDAVSLGNDSQGKPQNCTIKSISYPNGKTGVQNTAVITTQAQYPSSNGAFSSVSISSTVQNPSFAVPARASVVVQVHVNNNDGGIKQSGDFTVTVPVAGNPSPSSFPGAETGTIVYIDPGSYTIAGSNDSGYTKSLSAGCSGSLSAGAIDSCLITYDDIPTTVALTVTAVVKNDNGGTKQPSDFPLFIDGLSAISGVPVTGLAAGVPHIASAAVTPAGYTVSSPVWGTDCVIPGDGTITMFAGQKKTCTVVYDDDPPPAPICVDTVLMLDRTGSMGGSDLTDEKAAANNLLGLYGLLSPLPKSAVGVFGAVGASEPYNANIRQILTTDYSALINAVNTGLANSAGYTNLASAIDVSQAEFNVNGTPGKGHVLILLSDGGANRPNTPTSGDTGWFSPSANAQDANGELWSNPTGAYTDGVGDASDPVSENDQHRFYNFSLPAIPVGATIQGIELKTDAWATTATTVQTPTNVVRVPGSAVSPNQWTNPTRAFLSDDSYATNAAGGNQQAFGSFGFSIPSNATITGVQVTNEAKVPASTPVTTPTILSNGQGTYGNWTGDESDIDDTPVISCGSSDGNENISTVTTNDRESVVIDLTGVPNGATITDVNVSVSYTDDTSNGSDGTFKTFARLNGTNTDAVPNLVASGSSSSACNHADTQTIDVPDVVKSGSTALEVGVLKTGTDTSSVWVGSVRATVTYVVPITGALSTALSSNNGGTWTSVSRTNALDGTESADVPSGNSPTDMWGRTWTPADFNNGNFLLRVTNNSTTGVSVSLDQVTVNVFYTAPAQASVDCQLAADLSWNGGSNWTNEKTQIIDETETPYTFGSPTDDWSGHTWSTGDFTNASFRARVRASDPGGNCDNASVEHIDWMQLRVSYTTQSDPYQLALAATDIAKQAGTKIYTIHFGDNGSNGTPDGNDKGFLARLASGTTPNTGHEDGSLNDLSSSASTGDTGYVNPTEQKFDTGGDGNGFESSPTNAFTDDGNAANNIDGAGDRHRFYGYTFAIPQSATITGIEVRPNWWVDNTGSNTSLDVQLSWDGGTTWSSTRSDVNESTSHSHTGTLGGNTDLWGRTAWPRADFDPTKFRVRVISTSSSNSRDFFLDHVPARVYYSFVPENGDGDNFFVSPNSYDMLNIFQTIGEKECPALIAPPAAAVPTHGTLLVISHVINDNGGTAQSSNFEMTVTGFNPSPNTYPTSGVESPGMAVELDPGAYAVTGDTMGLLYDATSSGCSGTMGAGEIRTCTITYDDLPPAPGSAGLVLPPSNIIIGSWQEVP